MGAVMRLRRSLGFLVCAFLLASPVRAAEPIRPAIGQPVDQARALSATGDYPAALAKLHEAEAVPDKTPLETQIVNAMKNYITARAGYAAHHGGAAAVVP
jgi:hypothetical protein